MFNNLKVSKADGYFYQNLRDILKNGYYDFDYEVRPMWKDGTPAHSKFLLNIQETYDLNKCEFPITTLRPIAWKQGVGEILWIYRDASNDLDLLRQKYGVSWWDEWDIGNRSIGCCYGYTVKKYNLLNQLIEGLKLQPFGRRHIMSLWQNADLKQKHALDPCCFMTIWNVTSENGQLTLHMELKQRSSDYVVAGHINKIQYVALQMLVARLVDMQVGTFTHSVNNLHIYDRHIDIAKTLIERFEKQVLDKKPQNTVFALREGITLKDVMPEDFRIINYDPLPALSKLEMAI